MENKTQITFKLSDAEKDRIEEAGKRIGLKKSSFIRSASLEKANSILDQNNLDNKSQ